MSKFNYLLVKEKMNILGITQQDVAYYLSENDVPTSIDTVKSWFRKDDTRRAAPELSRIQLLGEMLDMDANQMITGFENTQYADVKFVPIIGEASCGLPITSTYQDTDRKTYYHGDYWHEKLYAVVACGDSMATDIEDGDEIVCDPTADILDGDIVHYEFLGEEAIKIYHDNRALNAVELIPYNQSPEFRTKAIRRDDENFNELKMSKVVSINKLRLNNRKARLRAVGRG